jgi:nucleotide-binding universal stress UspA family protein
MQGSRCAVALAPVGYRDQAGELTEIGAAVDGSPESAHALEAAIEVAGSRKRVRVISVATDLTDAWGFWGMAYALTEMGEASREVTQRIVDESLASLPEGVEADPVVLEGSAAIQLRRYATGNLDLLCIGSRGYGPVRRVLLGSVSSDLLTEVGCPVMVLPRA